MSNNITFTGNLTKDAVINPLTGGGSVLKCSVADNVGYGNNQKTNFYNVSIFGKIAEGSLINYLKKGTEVFISGELSAREYQHEGQTRTSLDINANQIKLVGKKGNTGEQTNNTPPVSAYDGDY